MSSDFIQNCCSPDFMTIDSYCSSSKCENVKTVIAIHNVLTSTVTTYTSTT